MHRIDTAASGLTDKHTSQLNGPEHHGFDSCGRKGYSRFRQISQCRLQSMFSMQGFQYHSTGLIAAAWVFQVLMKRNSTYIAFILAGALLGERVRWLWGSCCSIQSGSSLHGCLAGRELWLRYSVGEEQSRGKPAAVALGECCMCLPSVA